MLTILVQVSLRQAEINQGQNVRLFEANSHIFRPDIVVREVEPMQTLQPYEL